MKKRSKIEINECRDYLLNLHLEKNILKGNMKKMLIKKNILKEEKKEIESNYI